MENEKQWLDDGWKHDPEILKLIRRKMGDRGYPGIDMEDIDEVLDIATEYAPQELSAYKERLKEYLTKRMSECDPLFQIVYYDVINNIDIL